MSTSSHLGMRIAFVAVAIVLWFWTQRLVSAKAPVKTGVGDRLHDWSAPLHGKRPVGSPYSKRAEASKVTGWKFYERK